MRWRDRYPRVYADLRWTPRRWRLALRTLIAVLAVVLWGNIAHLPAPFWAVLTVLALTPLDEVPGIQKAIMRILGTAGGCLVGLALYVLFAQFSPALFLAIGATVFIATYLMLRSVFYPYAFLLLGFTSVLVTYTGLQDPASVSATAWGRFTEISVGVMIAVLANALLWPVSATGSLRSSLASKLRAVAGTLDPLVADSLAPPRALDLFPPSSERLSVQMTQLALTFGEGSSMRARAEAWRDIVTLAESLRMGAYELAVEFRRPGGAEAIAPLRPEIATCARSLQARIERLAASVEREDESLAQAGLPAQADPNAPRRTLDQAIAELRAAGTLHDWPLEKVTRFDAIVEGLHATTTKCTALETASASAHSASLTEAAASFIAPAPLLVPAPFSAFNPELALEAFKTMLAVLLCLVFGIMTHWTLGLTMVTTCTMLAATPTVGAILSKAGTRALGAVVGGVIALFGIFWVVPDLTSVAGLLVFTGVVSAPLCYLNAAGPSVAYFGMQAAFAFSIGVTGSMQPSIDLWPPTSRALGIVIGATVFAAIAMLVYPRTAQRTYRRGMARFVQSIADLMRAQPPGMTSAAERTRVLVGQQVASFAWCSTIESAIGEADSEPTTAGARWSHAAAVDALTDNRLLIRATVQLAESRSLLANLRPPDVVAAQLTRSFELCASMLAELASEWDRNAARGVGPSTPPGAIGPSSRIAAFALLEGDLGRTLQQQRDSGAMTSWGIPILTAVFAAAERLEVFRERFAVAERWTGSTDCGPLADRGER